LKPTNDDIYFIDKFSSAIAYDDGKDRTAQEQKVKKDKENKNNVSVELEKVNIPWKRKDMVQ